MRALIAGLGALTVLMTVGCADQGNLMIRCPDAGGALAVTDGQVTIDGVVMRVAADLNEPSSPEKGLTFAINVQLPALPSAKAAPSVECVRLRMPQQNAQWDATATHVEEFRDSASTRIRVTNSEGPHWSRDDLAEVTIWLKTPSGRHVLTLGRQPIHRGGG